MTSLLALTFFFIFATAANAGIEDDIQQHLNKGDFGTALTTIDAGLAEDASNEKLLLAKGFTLIKLNRLDDAVIYYKSLKEKLTNNPEPSNNLAMAYRIQGQYDMAIKEFNHTIKAFPAYANAYGNLGDTYVEMAQKQYQLGVDATQNTVLQNKVRLSKNFHRIATQSTPTANTPAKADTLTPQQAVLHSLNLWVIDWVSLNPDRYLSHYSKQFTPSDSLTLNQWIKRKKRILGSAESIKVHLSNINITFLQDGAAQAQFTQKYESTTDSNTSNKLLTLQKTGKQWLIVNEGNQDI